MVPDAKAPLKPGESLAIWGFYDYLCSVGASGCLLGDGGSSGNIKKIGIL